MTDDTAWSIAWPEGEEQCRISGEHQPYIAEGPTDGHPPERVACLHCDVTPQILISDTSAAGDVALERLADHLG